MSLFEGFSNSFHHKAPIPQKCKIPPNLSSFYIPQADAITVEDGINNLIEYHVSKESIDFIFNATKLQSESLIWKDMRLGRITASVVHDVLHTKIDKPSKSLVQKLCYKQPIINSPALSWGIINESTALQSYENLIKDVHKDLSITKSGLLLSSDYHFLGASADAICECECHGKWLIEVKCPYKHREAKDVSECLLDKNFCLDSFGKLKQTHRYMTQIQMQLYIYKVERCDLVVWTPNFCVSNEVIRDPNFVENIPKLVDFFRKVIAPELVQRKLNMVIVDDKMETELYCYCQTPNDENIEMLGCDNEECKYKWIHFKCANIKRPPKGAWYCKDCKKKRKCI